MNQQLVVGDCYHDPRYSSQAVVITTIRLFLCSVYESYSARDGLRCFPPFAVDLLFCDPVLCILVLGARRLFPVSSKFVFALSHIVKCFCALFWPPAFVSFHSIVHARTRHDRPSSYTATIGSMLSVPFEICSMMICAVFRCVAAVFNCVKAPFVLMWFLFKSSFEDLPSSNGARFTRLLYAVYELSVVSFFVVLRCLLVGVYHMLVAFFSLVDLLCKSVNRHMKSCARNINRARHVYAGALRARRHRSWKPSTSGRSRTRGRNQKR